MDPRTHKPLNPKPNPSPDVNAPVSKSIPNANPNPSSSRVGEIGSNHEVKEIESNENHKEPPNLDQYHSPLAADSNENWQSADGLVTGLQSTHGTSNDDEDDIGFCNDDTFSSFLNSLINEDVFGNHNHHHQQQQQQQLQQVQQPSNVIAPLPHPAISVQATFSSSPRTVWEPAALTSTSAPLVHDQKDSMSPWKWWIKLIWVWLKSVWCNLLFPFLCFDVVLASTLGYLIRMLIKALCVNIVCEMDPCN